VRATRNVRLCVHPLKSARPDGGGRARAGWTAADALDETIAQFLVAVEDEVFLGGKVVVDRLLGDRARASDVQHGDPLVAPLGEQPGGGGGDELPVLLLATCPQAD